MSKKRGHRGGARHRGTGARESGIPPGLWVTLFGVTGITVLGVALANSKKNNAKDKGTSGLRDLPTHYPFYPRVMPSYEVPMKVHRDAEIIQHQEVNPAGKVIISEEMQPVENVQYLPQFTPPASRRLPDNPFEFSGIEGEEPEEEFMGAAEEPEEQFLGTTRPKPYYPTDFEAVNATFEKVDGLKLEGINVGEAKAPATVEEMFAQKIMQTTIEAEEDTKRDQKRFDDELGNREATADDLDIDDTAPDEDEKDDEEAGDVMEEDKAEKEEPEGKDEAEEKEDEFEELDEDDIEKALDEAEKAPPAPSAPPKAIVEMPGPPIKEEVITEVRPVLPGRPPGGAPAEVKVGGKWIGAKPGRPLPEHAVAKGVRRKVTRIAGVDARKLAMLAELGEYDKAKEEAFEALENGLMNGLF